MQSPYVISAIERKYVCTLQQEYGSIFEIGGMEGVYGTWTKY